jgi:hypothetical protein
MVPINVPKVTETVTNHLFTGGGPPVAVAVIGFCKGRKQISRGQ